MADIPVSIEWENLDQAFDELEREIEDTVRGLSVMLWNRVLAQTPQMYGRLVASWTYSLQYPIALDRSHLIDVDDLINKYGYESEEWDGKGFPGLYKGHPEAITIANEYNQGADSFFELGQTIYFANGADHGEGQYGPDIERGDARLRAVNRPGRMASRALDYAAAKFRVGMSEEMAQTLRSLTIRTSAV